MDAIEIIRVEEIETIMDIPVVVVGAGGTGLCAALAVRDAGVDVLVVERDRQPLGTTSMSTGLIPACGSVIQKTAGVEDNVDAFAGDIVAKTKGAVDEAMVRSIVGNSAATIDWLSQMHSLDLSLVDGFTYPGHSVRRMHGMPSRSGGELMGALYTACETAGVDFLTESTVNRLFVNGIDRVIAIGSTRPDGSEDVIGCGALILACCGFAGDQKMVAELIPELEHATFHGHPGNKGHAIKWGQELGAAMADLSAYQGHAGLAAGYGIPILWPLIVEGGVQVNRQGLRFANEASGYSEQAVEVLRQEGHVAWSIYDERRHAIMEQFDDYQQAMSAGCLKKSDDLSDLAGQIGVNPDGLIATFDEVSALSDGGAKDRFGRSFAGKAKLEPLFYAVKVTGALFHTQGGLEVDEHGRVLRRDRTRFPNLYAGGGAARGISGPGADGYLAGNGLMTATTLGRLSGDHAAQLHGQTAQ